MIGSVSYFRHDGLIIMATNRPYDLDEAMHRRIMIAVEFRQPDHLLRKAIWESHVPKEMKLADDIDLVRNMGYCTVMYSYVSSKDTRDCYQYMNLGHLLYSRH